MLVAREGAGQRHAVVAAHRPAAHHGVGDFRVELEAEGAVTDTDRLHLEDVALGQQRRAAEPGPSTAGGAGGGGGGAGGGGGRAGAWAGGWGGGVTPAGGCGMK